MKRILLISDSPGTLARMGRRSASIDLRGSAELIEALEAPGASYAGVVWHRAGTRAAPASLAKAMRLRKDLPFIVLEARASRGARTERRGKFRACVPMPVTAELMCDIVEREARLMKTEAGLTSSRARARMHARRLSVLADIAKAANSVLEPRRVMEVLMSRVQDLIRTEAWTVLLVDEKDHILSLELTSGGKIGLPRNYRQKIGQGVSGWVVQYKKPLFINDVREDRRFDARLDMLTGFRTRSILSAPLISRGRIIGAVELMNKKRGRFGADDLAMLTMLVEPGAIALENAMLYQRSAELTVTDDLTKLFNSRYLNIQLRREIKRSRRYGVPVSLIFLDLDGFKKINDSFGHLSGSRALFEVGQVIQDTVREIDIVSRYGGDEFTVILPQTGADGAMIIADRIRESVANRAFLTEQGLEVKLTASFGVATFPDHGETREDLIQGADQAMYKVKDQGKNGVALAMMAPHAKKGRI